MDEFEKRQGNINDFSSIRFMRMFLTSFKKPIVLRFGTLDLVRGKSLPTTSRWVQPVAEPWRQVP